MSRANYTEDEALLISFLHGDNKAFASIYNKYVDTLFAYGIGLGFDRETLKDAIQDTFVKFYIHKKQLKEITLLKYYLLSMLRNRLLDIYKSTRKEEIFDPSELSFLVEADELDNLIEHEEKQSLIRRVNRLLDVLTGRQKEAVYLRFIQELEYEKIGNMLNMTAPAVRKLISRAIKRMREEK